jgi:hypothetical protein
MEVEAGRASDTFRRKRGLADFSEEIKAHLEHETERLMEQGLSEADAGRQHWSSTTRDGKHRGLPSPSVPEGEW